MVIEYKKVQIKLLNKENFSYVDKEINCASCIKKSTCQGTNCSVVKQVELTEPESVKTSNDSLVRIDVPAYNKYAFRRLNKQLNDIIKAHTR